MEGLWVDRDWHTRMFEKGERGAGGVFELVKKASGDSWEDLASDYFLKDDYKRICTICKELGIEPPEYVWGD